MNNTKAPRTSWLFKMAWRDSRRNRSRLLLFISSIIMGIAALVAIDSLGTNLRNEVDAQAASLIGADLEFSAGRPYSDDTRQLIDSLGDRRSEERRFSSMVYFVKNGGTRLIEVRALGGDFPYYGQLDTEPQAAGKSFRQQQQALVDQSLMLQFDARVGDSIKVGNLHFAIAGTLMGAPGQTGLNASVAPVVYIPIQFLSQTGLEQKGSRINYRYYVKYDRAADVDAIVETFKDRLRLEGINYDTIETQKEDTVRSFSDLTQFLSLVGFIALLLGSIGVASAIHIYIREKINTIAVLRCLGATSVQAFLIYLFQILAIGFIGSVTGAALGTLIQQFLPMVLKEFFPLEIDTSISWGSVLQGIMLGIIIALLFALPPLVSIRKISPLNTLRLALLQNNLFRDPLRWLVYLLIFLFVVSFSYLQLGEWTEALVFTLAICIAFAALTAVAALLMWAVRKLFPASWSYLWRQGLANLYRPNNQTGILIVSIGLGTALICTLFFVQGILLNRVTLSSSGNQPNMVLFDIQTAQREGMEALVKQHGLPVHSTVPIVTMRLEAVNKITAATLQKDSTIDMQRWVFSREYRVTFRDSLISSEKITAGRWTGSAVAGKLIPVSLDQRFAENNKIKLGDTLLFNVQGAMLTTVVGSMRQVDWNRVQTNFLVVFPTGILEEAPQFHVIMTHVPSTEASARLQQAVVKTFPNVSIIDLNLVLSIIDELLDKIGFVIRFMAAFSIITGMVVLIASVLISKYQRIQEGVLLRTLGGSRKQLFAITALEYFFLGALAAATGIVLALVGSWALAKYTFETVFSPEWWPVLLAFVAVCAVTVFIGLLNSRAVVNKPPLEVLRKES